MIFFGRFPYGFIGVSMIFHDSCKARQTKLVVFKHILSFYLPAN